MENNIEASETKTCPTCKTKIPAGAKKCPNCQSDLRSWFRRHPILTFLLVLFVLPFVTVPLLGGSSGSSSPSSNVGVEQPTTAEEVIDKTTLEYKIRHRKASKEERFVVSGMEIRIGEAADSVFQKLPGSLGLKKAQDKEYGLMVEHNYGRYSILFARNVPAGGAGGSWHIVHDIYPSDYKP